MRGLTMLIWHPVPWAKGYSLHSFLCCFVLCTVLPQRQHYPPPRRKRVNHILIVRSNLPNF